MIIRLTKAILFNCVIVSVGVMCSNGWTHTVLYIQGHLFENNTQNFDKCQFTEDAAIKSINFKLGNKGAAEKDAQSTRGIIVFSFKIMLSLILVGRFSRAWKQPRGCEGKSYLTTTYIPHYK